jgi:hypothetical protein
MQLTGQVLLRQFGSFNTAIWPMQVVAYILVVAALFLAAKRTKYSAHVIAAILAAFWLWNGVKFWLPLGPSFPPAWAFAALWIIQGLAFLVGIVKPSVSYRVGSDVYSLVGIALIVYAAIGYPLFGYIVGHIYPRAGIVGVIPCPTVILTFGLLLCTDTKVPKSLLVIPLLWGLLSLAWIALGIVEDIGLIVGALLATAMIMYRDRQMMPGTAFRAA